MIRDLGKPSHRAKRQAKKVLINLPSRAEREAKGVMLNLHPRAQREAREVSLNLRPRAKRDATGSLVTQRPRAKREAKGSWSMCHLERSALLRDHGLPTYSGEALSLRAFA